MLEKKFFMKHFSFLFYCTFFKSLFLIVNLREVCSLMAKRVESGASSGRIKVIFKKTNDSNFLKCLIANKCYSIQLKCSSTSLKKLFRTAFCSVVISPPPWHIL